MALTAEQIKALFEEQAQRLGLPPMVNEPQQGEIDARQAKLLRDAMKRMQSGNESVDDILRAGGLL